MHKSVTFFRNPLPPRGGRGGRGRWWSEQGRGGRVDRKEWEGGKGKGPPSFQTFKYLPASKHLNCSPALKTFFLLLILPSSLPSKLPFLSF